MRRITGYSFGRRDSRGLKSNKGETAYGGGAQASCLLVASILLAILCLMSIWPGLPIFLEKTGQVFGC